MAASKQKYSVTRMQRLPPIREENFGARSPRITPRYEVKKKQVTIQEPEVNRQRPRIHVRPLPSKPQPNISYDNGRSMAVASNINNQPPIVYGRPTPVHPVNNAVVDGLVADYLHYAAYGHIIPIYEGTGNMTCPCCTVRNQENVRTLLGFPVQRHQEQKPPEKAAPAFDPWKVPKENSGQPQPIPGLPQHNWMSKQPLPTYTNYLNPEFNRPVYVYQKPPESRNRGLVVENVLHATAQYDESMRKLERFGK